MKGFIKSLRSERPSTGQQVEAPIQTMGLESTGTLEKPTERPRRKSRRRLLARGLGVAAVTAGVAAGAALQMNEGGTTPAHATGTEGPTTFNNNGSSVPAVTANSTSSASSKVNAIKATSTGYTGIAGYTNSTDIRASGVFGQGGTVGIAGYAKGASTAPIVKVGVYGSGSNGPTAPLGGVGVEGESDTSYGVYGISRGALGNGAGVGGFTLDLSGTTAVGVRADGASGYGVYSTCTGPTGYGVYAEGDTYGIVTRADNTSGTGISSFGSSRGVTAFSDTSSGTGLYCSGNVGLFSSGNPTAGSFSGDVNVSGTLTKGGGSFKIDHPLDPANKFLSHSFVESPDMKNVYDGVVTLDANGEAVVTLPAWFEVLNKEFRYQLTPIGAPGPTLHIAAEVSNLSFKIAGGTAGMKVSWQVTGIRQDAWAQAHPIVVEQDKSLNQRGHYLHPELYGHPSNLNILDAPYAKIVKKPHK